MIRVKSENTNLIMRQNVKKTVHKVRLHKIATLPSFENICNLCRWLLVVKCIGYRVNPPPRYTLHVTPLSAFLLFCFSALLLSPFSSLFAQNNRLTNEHGQLLWQYNQTVTKDEEKLNTFLVTFVFINGIEQTAISLRQECFNSSIEWFDISDYQAEKEERVEFITANLLPNQYVVWKYFVKTKPMDKEFFLEKSALLIMNEDFEVRKEIIPQQKVESK